MESQPLPGQESVDHHALEARRHQVDQLPGPSQRWIGETAARMPSRQDRSASASGSRAGPSSRHAVRQRDARRPSSSAAAAVRPAPRMSGSRSDVGAGRHRGGAEEDPAPAWPRCARPDGSPPAAASPVTRRREGERAVLRSGLARQCGVAREPRHEVGPAVAVLVGEADVAGGGTTRPATSGWGTPGRSWSGRARRRPRAARGTSRRSSRAGRGGRAPRCGRAGRGCSRPCPQSPAPLVDRDRLQPLPPVARAQLPGRGQSSHATTEDDDPRPPRSVRRGGHRRPRCRVVGGGEQVPLASASAVRQSSGLDGRRQRASSTAARRRETRPPGRSPRGPPRSGRPPPLGSPAASEYTPAGGAAREGGGTLRSCAPPRGPRRPARGAIDVAGRACSWRGRPGWTPQRLLAHEPQRGDGLLEERPVGPPRAVRGE